MVMESSEILKNTVSEVDKMDDGFLAAVQGYTSVLEIYL